VVQVLQGLAASAWLEAKGGTKYFGPHTRACPKAKLGQNMMSQKGYLFVEFSDLKMEKNMDEIWRKKIWVEA
jgi:hypothetical protein